ncbi:MAG: response regulator transcription factor [Acidobacteriota bacterium]|nr:response regulator transcription factor [Acidobacteriota bacterium]
MRLLLIEDESDSAEMLAKGLREQTYAVDVAPDGAAALEKAFVNQYDLVLLDVMLPGVNGFQVCQALRKSNITAPILLLTALEGIRDRIYGLDAGADDYLAKPFDFGELLARIRALLRRGPRLSQPVLTVDNLELDTRSRRVSRAGQPVELTAKEYALLECLVREAGKVMGRQEISEHVWDEEYDPFSNLIEVYIQRLRRKIDTPGQKALIQTRRGEGYWLAAEPVQR